ncbi:replication protein [Francisella philomiragia]|uniref:replication protein n=1 Tax=Francisella philomiragia TaxID=28110 RepID=UPI0022441D58|nr:replication protein [Francisella philomiragia]
MKSNKFIPNSYQTPNAIVDELAAVLSDKAFKIYHIIVRKTLGWNKEKDSISTSQLMELSGTKKPHTIYKVVDELTHYNLVKKVKIDGKSNNYAIDFSHIEEAKNTSKPMPKKGTSTSATKGQYQKRELVPQNGTTPMPQIGSSTSATKGHTQTNNIKHNKTTTTTTIEIENIDREKQQEKTESVRSRFPYFFDEIKKDDSDIKTELKDWLIKLNLTISQADTVLANYPLDVVDNAIESTLQAQSERKIAKTPARYLHGILNNYRAIA